ncbi:MAG: nuclear transport factor 2 family protein [Acidimicrobiales bacterium]
MQEIEDLVARWTDAEQRSDVAALGALLDPDFRGIAPQGFVLTKEQWLDRFRHGDLVNDSFAWEDTDVRVYGDTAFVIGIQAQTTRYQGNDVSGRFRGTLAALPNDGRWSVVHVQVSLLAGPPGR